MGLFSAPGVGQANDQSESLVDGAVVREGAGHIGFEQDKVGPGAIAFRVLAAHPALE